MVIEGALLVLCEMDDRGRGSGVAGRRPSASCVPAAPAHAPEYAQVILAACTFSLSLCPAQEAVRVPCLEGDALDAQKYLGMLCVCDVASYSTPGERLTTTLNHRVRMFAAFVVWDSDLRKLYPRAMCLTLVWSTKGQVTP